MFWLAPPASVGRVSSGLIIVKLRLINMAPDTSLSELREKIEADFVDDRARALN
jgi:hypothetical protein